eukprot:8502942-Lingulodinium_polyedra.AAC.1
MWPWSAAGSRPIRRPSGPRRGTMPYAGSKLSLPPCPMTGPARSRSNSMLTGARSSRHSAPWAWLRLSILRA